MLKAKNGRSPIIHSSSNLLLLIIPLYFSPPFSVPVLGYDPIIAFGSSTVLNTSQLAAHIIVFNPTTHFWDFDEVYSTL